MGCPISRRDFLNASLLAAGSALLTGVSPAQLLSEEDWTGYGGVGDYRRSNGNTYEVMSAGHTVRDGGFNRVAPIDTGEVYDVVVIGGGISGLAAALFLQRGSGGKRSCLVLENHPIFGGEAKQNEFLVDGHRLTAHQASAAFFPPHQGTYLDEFYKSIGVRWQEFQYQKSAGDAAAAKLGTTPYLEGGSTSGLYFGKAFHRPAGVWLKDPYANGLRGAPLTAEEREDLMRAQGDQGGSHFELPKRHGDKASRALDSVSLEEHLMRTRKISRATVRRFLSPVAGGGSGLGADALSAYADYAADVLLPWDYSAGTQMFPGGNAGIARHILKQLLPAAITGPATLAGVATGRVQFGELDRDGRKTRIRLRSTVIDVQHEGAPERASHVTVLYTQGGKVYRLRARSAVIAGGSWTAKHLVPDLPQAHKAAYEQSNRSACLMANVAVRNWRFLWKLGLTECQWFEGIGNYMAIRKAATFGGGPATISPDTPVVLTLKILFSYPGEPIEPQCQKGRGELISPSFRKYELRIRRQFTEMFARSGFDARRDVAGIILNRWGHAYLSPQPGFFFGRAGAPGPGEFLQKNLFSRIAFANSDLSGIMDHRTSILEAKRAVEQVTPLLNS